ncbi:MAG TPA: zf-TFIIB domain-containing protein [Gemmatimonadales bacterium]|nr:zf-TFIIB domain-containing protein [Gemmatimonadales bacterium]
MSHTEKPSRNEDEYFAKLEAERLERKRQELAALANDAERKSHYMRCPKCGGHLETIEFHRVQVDRCPDCAGIWLDNGEIDAIVAHEDKSLLSRALGDFMGSLKAKKGK